MVILENIDIDIDIDMVILENIDIDIDIDKAILQNIDIDKISNRFKFGISNRASWGTRLWCSLWLGVAPNPIVTDAPCHPCPSCLIFRPMGSTKKCSFRNIS